MKAVHARTGFPCTIMTEYGRRGELVMCNFGERANPFTWVPISELTIVG